ncbi:UNVERIFIED_ORG: glutathionyl-hydroquinone reductase [Arthrobacter sp. UYCu721]
MTGGADFNRTPVTLRTGSPTTAAPASMEPGWRVEAGRYRLIAARACQCANRTVIVRKLLGLVHAISLGQPGPTHDARSWTFDLDPGGVDPFLGIERIQSAYSRRLPDYPRGIPVPAIVDVAGGTVVTNNFPQITLDFVPRGRHHHGGRRPPVPHLGQVRCRLPRAFQGQPHRDRAAGCGSGRLAGAPWQGIAGRPAIR